MHLMALGAFWPNPIAVFRTDAGKSVLMHLLALGAFWHDGVRPVGGLVEQS